MSIPLTAWALSLGFWPFFPNSAGFQTGWSVAMDLEDSRTVLRLSSHHRSGVLGSPIRLDHRDMMAGYRFPRFGFFLGVGWWTLRSRGGLEEALLPVLSAEVYAVRSPLRVRGWGLEGSFVLRVTPSRPALYEAGIHLRLRRGISSTGSQQQD